MDASTTTRPTDPNTLRARRWILIAAIIVSALGFIDGTVLPIATPRIRESLDATLVQSLWFSSAYMLPLASLILVGGAVGDRFGVKRVILAGLLVFLTASILCSLAPSAEWFIAARAAMGTGAALIIPGALALIARAYPINIRGSALGIWAAASAILTAVGPLIGGSLLLLDWEPAWRLIFLINLPLGLFAAWILLTKVRTYKAAPDVTLDWAGAVLVITALGTGAFALSRLGELDVSVLPFAIVSLIAICVFVYWETKVPSPMLPLQMFSNRTFAVSNIVTFCLYFSLSALMFYLPMTVISAWSVRPLEAAAAFAPLSVFIGLLSSRVGKLTDRIGSAPLISTGAALACASIAAMALTLHQRNFWGIVLPLNAALGIGMAFVVGPLSASVMGSVSDEKIGTASGINNAISRMSGLIAVAAMGSTAAIAYRWAGGTGSFGAFAFSPENRDATDAGLRAILWITATLSGLSAILALVGLRRHQPKT